MTEITLRSEVLQAAQIDGWMEIEELDWLLHTAAKYKVIVEVGSWKGRSTKALAFGTKGHVYAVDHWKGSDNDPACYSFYKEAADKGPDEMFSIFQANLSQEIMSGKVVPIRQPHQNAPSFLSQSLGENKADLVFIDGDHRYESVKRDIMGFRRLLSPGGLLSGHDYRMDQPGVIKAVDELLPGFGRGPGTLWYFFEPK